jgi:hypothetical protein
MKDRPLRIGDAERDQAVGALGDHYAAGRLTKDEFDARSEQAWSARFRHDLEPLFADLPSPTKIAVSSGPAMPRVPQPRSSVVRGFWWVLPAMAVAFVAMAVVAGAPWLLFMLFWIAAAGGFGNRRGHAREWRRRQQWLEHQWRHQYGPGRPGQFHTYRRQWSADPTPDRSADGSGDGPGDRWPDGRRT